MISCELLPLYGDGVNDDTAALQQRIDLAGCELVLPSPEVCYLISAPLALPSNFRLVLPRFAHVRLADGSNCFMLKNRRPREADTGFWTPGFPCEEQDIAQNIEVFGGIWDMNNLGQNPNPFWTGVYEPTGYIGYGMLFYAVRGLKLSNMTLKDPVNFAVTLDRVSYFTVEDIVFDYNQGNPVPVNMDGIHLNGNCHFGLIRNLKGACYDDAVALNADEGSDGAISDIEVSGIWATDCHSAVRLLTGRNRLENIHIHDIYGTYYQYCVGFTCQEGREVTGEFSGISVDHVYVSKAPRYSCYQKDGMGQFALLFVERMCRIRDLSISDFYRRETINPFPAMDIEAGAEIDCLELSRIHTENLTGEEMAFMRNNGTVGILKVNGIYTGTDPVAVGNGTVASGEI